MYCINTAPLVHKSLKFLGDAPSSDGLALLTAFALLHVHTESVPCGRQPRNGRRVQRAPLCLRAPESDAAQPLHRLSVLRIALLSV